MTKDKIMKIDSCFTQNLTENGKGGEKMKPYFLILGIFELIK